MELSVNKVGSSNNKQRERERERKLTTISLNRLASLGGSEAPIVVVVVARESERRRRVYGTLQRRKRCNACAA